MVRLALLVLALPAAALAASSCAFTSYPAILSGSAQSAVVTPVLSPYNTANQLVSLVNSATTSIKAEIQYTEWNFFLLNAMVDAANNRNVSVKIIVSQPTDNTVAEDLLTYPNIRIAYLGNATTINYDHNKGLIVDTQTVYVGSANHDVEAFCYNREAGVLVQHPDIATHFDNLFERNWAISIEQTTAASSTPVAYSPAPTPSSNINAVGGAGCSASASANLVLPFTISSHSVNNVLAFSNPDSSRGVFINGINKATKSIRMALYSFGASLELACRIAYVKQLNPDIDITLVMTAEWVSSSDKKDTITALNLLSTLNVTIYTIYVPSGQSWYAHNKYWIIDDNITYIFSGNMALSSFSNTATSDWCSSTVNAEWGLGVADTGFTSVMINFFESELQNATAYTASATVTNTCQSSYTTTSTAVYFPDTSDATSSPTPSPVSTSASTATATPAAATPSPSANVHSSASHTPSPNPQSSASPTPSPGSSPAAPEGSNSTVPSTTTPTNQPKGDATGVRLDRSFFVAVAGLVVAAVAF